MLVLFCFLLCSIMYVKYLMANCENVSISLWIWRGGFGGV